MAVAWLLLLVATLPAQAGGLTVQAPMHTILAESGSTLPLYQAPGMWTWDYWFAQTDDAYHAFYLMKPGCLGPEQRWRGVRATQMVGHAVSRDLVTWHDLGPVVVPTEGTWCDIAIATGSVVRHDGRWWMVWTGHGSQTKGIGLSVSDDLCHWETVGDGPVLPLESQLTCPDGDAEVTFRGLADPYIHPDPIDGRYLMLLNAQVDGVPAEESGCLVALSSSDLLTWRPERVLSLPGWFERMETPQLFEHPGRWYLYFGGVRADAPSDELAARLPGELAAGTHGNYVFTAPSPAGPFEPEGDWALRLDPGGYICKVLIDPTGQDVMLYTTSDSLSLPYPVSFPDGGSVRQGVPGIVYIINPEKKASDLSDARTIANRVGELTSMPCIIDHYLDATSERITKLQPAAIIIGGQGTPWWEYTGEELAPACQAIREAECPILGICGGHQLIAQAYGGTVGAIRQEADEAGPGYTGYFRERGWLGVEVTADDPLFDGYSSDQDFWLNHCEEVKAKPKELVVTATGADGSIMAMRHVTRPIYGVQFHPEINWAEHPAGKHLMQRCLQVAGIAQRVAAG